MPQLCRDCLSLEVQSGAACRHCGSARLVWHDDLATLAIAHVDCDSFYASVEKRDNPALRDKPLIVGHPGGRGVVTTACYIARRFGARSAMPMFKALELCPQAVVIPPDMEKYRRVSSQIRAIFNSTTEVIEPVSLDEAYLDLSPAEHLFDRAPALSLAEIALRIEREVGITVSIGLAANKFLAKLASDMNKPRGFSVIGPREAKTLLAPMSVRCIHGVGEVLARRMAGAGIETIGQLQKMSEMEMVARWGSFGRRLALYVRGEDDRKVTPDRPRKSVSGETTFPRNLSRREDLEQALWPLCRKVAERMERGGVAGMSVVLKLKTGDFATITRSHRLTAPSRSAEVMFRHARALLRREVDGRAFRLIGIGFTDLCDGKSADQPDLFQFAAERKP
ncbi:DNA polymerase IV [Telmatospirillum sp. J64-1]|uniref:DNA polymerase IV n=1 Tax=Telmatospirillum sp. J64-1 TaxID=2502183 RepID=UPI00115EC6E1|nr:DNA polymerase IV [Telmatospirillum sp. J64-1]